MNGTISNSVAWIAASADGSKDVEQRQGQEDDVSGQAFSTKDLPSADLPVRISLTAGEIANLPVHQFPAKAAGPFSQTVAREEMGIEDKPDVANALQQTHQVGEVEEALEEAEFGDDDRERRIYRGRTVAMLRRYLRYSIETGRLPSLLGREFFRAQITKYQVSTFEDRVIFVHDMERCLDQLDEFSRQVLGRVVLQEYEHEEAARLMGCTRMTVHRKLIEALDRLSDILVAVGLLDGLGANRKKSCQGGESDDFSASACEHGK
jgi:DNA-directed RNA polymerase specialized sigma24 family protein